MALTCVISEITRDIGRKSRFFSYRLAFDAPVRGGGFSSEYCHVVWYGKTRMAWLPDGEKIEDMFICFGTIHERDGRTDRQTDGRTCSDGIGCAYAWHRAAKMETLYRCRSITSPNID